ncbi:hypothetical protein AMTRI_Chr03g146720 [Amborella trichopoda]
MANTSFLLQDLASCPPDVPNSKLNFQGGLLSLKHWDEKMGAYCKSKFWILIGVPLHLWSQYVFKTIGNSCGEFISVHWKSFGTLPLGNIISLIASESIDNILNLHHLHCNGFSYHIKVGSNLHDRPSHDHEGWTTVHSTPEDC